MPYKNSASSLSALDSFDRWTAGAMLLLALWFSWLVLTVDTTAPPSARVKLVQLATAATIDPEYAGRLKSAKQLLYAGNMEKLKPLLEEMIVASPYNAEPLMLLADYHIRKQEAIAAMHAFRQALDLNLDFLEKKSPRYQGKKIRNIVVEAEREIVDGLDKHPEDPQMKANRKELYYMMRKLAGGCSD